MMRREARWLGDLLAGDDTSRLDPMLSVGSGSRDFRMRFQPWIERDVYGPLAARGVHVLHHEMAPADGVDVVGDLADDHVLAELRSLGVRTILCLNVFEHVRDRSGLAAALTAALPVGGLLVVTVPRRFPYHADPIDTLYRPAPADLAKLFDGSVTVVARGSVRCESLTVHWLSKPGKWDAIRKVLCSATKRSASDSPAPDGAPPVGTKASFVETARQAFLSTEVSYVVLEKSETP